MSDLTASEVVIIKDETNLSLSFVIAGDPPVQQRPRMNCKKAVKKVPIYYDPSSLKKKGWKKVSLKRLLIMVSNHFLCSRRNIPILCSRMDCLSMWYSTFVVDELIIVLKREYYI